VIHGDMNSPDTCTAKTNIMVQYVVLIKQDVLLLTFDKLLHKAIVSNYASESENFNLFQG